MTDRGTFHDYLLRRTLAAESYGANVARELVGHLDRASRDLSRRVAGLNGKVFRRTHLRRTQVEVNGVLKNLAEKYPETLNRGRKAAIRAEYDAVTRRMRGEQGKRIRESVYTLPARATNQILTAPIGGKFLDDWLTDHFGAMKSRIRAELTQSIVLAEGMPQAAKRLRDAFAISRKGADFIAQTAIMQASNTARDEVFRENEKAIERYRVVATLDGRTCISCGNLDGQTAKKRDDLPYFPLHGRCRCTVVPETVFEEIVQQERPAVTEHSKKTVHHRDGSTSTDFTVEKAKKVPAKTTFKQFFDRQPEKWKQEYLGGGRYELYKKSGVDLGDMSRNNRVLTLEQLQKAA